MIWGVVNDEVLSRETTMTIAARERAIHRVLPNDPPIVATLMQLCRIPGLVLKGCDKAGSVQWVITAIRRAKSPHVGDSQQDYVVRSEGGRLQVWSTRDRCLDTLVYEEAK